MSIAAIKHHIDEQTDPDMQALLSHLTLVHGATEALYIPKPQDNIEAQARDNFEITTSFGLLFRAITRQKRLEIDFDEFQPLLSSMTPRHFEETVQKQLEAGPHIHQPQGKAIVMRLPLTTYLGDAKLHCQLLKLGWIHTATGHPLNGQSPYALLSYRLKAS